MWVTAQRFLRPLLAKARPNKLVEACNTRRKSETLFYVVSFSFVN